jgi:hyaluronan synthase
VDFLGDARFTDQSSISSAAIAFDRSSAREPSERWAYVVYALILGSFAVVSYFQIEGVVLRLLREAQLHHAIRPFLYPSLLWTAMGMLLFSLRTGFWIAYRPYPSADHLTAPKVSVIIPAYNEGAMVLTAIKSVARAHYPRDRLEIVVIDDGSKDDTWEYISRAAAQYPDLVVPLRHERNRGKREALSWGFETGRGDVFVTLDSDSAIEPDALLALVGPFADPRVGAVAGKVVVYNRRDGLIPRMLHVRYILSFDMLRSVESMYRTVYCCPGALAALRAAPVRALLDRWRNQTFLGQRCTFGEDRAMTNYLLEAGYDTIYQRAAVVHTVVPTTWSKMCRMLLRWERSGVREEIRLARILWRRPPAICLMAAFDRFVVNFRHPIYYVSLGILACVGVDHPSTVIRTLTAIGFMALLNTLYFLRSERSLEFLFGVLFSYMSALTMFWIYPYAVVTVRARSWLTR